MDPKTTSDLILIGAIGTQLGILVGLVFAGLAARDAKRTTAATQIIAVDTARIATDTKVETAAQTLKIDTVAKETAVVLGHVNSEKTSDAKTIEFQARENVLLRDQLRQQDRVAEKLAAAYAAALHIQATVAVAPTPLSTVEPEPVGHDRRAGDVGTFEQIEQHTAATAANTARTDAAVQALPKQDPP